MRGIYLIRNSVNGRVYVGSAMNLRARRAVHLHLLVKGKHHCAWLQCSWSKHGAGVFTWQAIEFVADPVNLVEREQYWIDYYKLLPSGLYNAAPLAGSQLGIKRSDATRAKIRAVRIGQPGRPHTAETKAKIGASSKGKKHSVETRAKISAGAKGNKWCLGRPQTDATKAALLLANKGKKASEETRLKLSAARAGVAKSVEHVANQRASQLARHQRVREERDRRENEELWAWVRSRHPTEVDLSNNGKTE